MVIDEVMQMAVQYHQTGHLVEAEQMYREVLNQDPHNPDALHLLGMIARRSGQLYDAASLIQRAIKIRPDSPHYHGNLGLIFTELDRPGDAIACYQKAIALKPDYAEAHTNLGTVLRQAGRHAESVAAMEKAIAIQPRLGEAYSNLSVTLAEMGQLDRALEVLGQALKLNPFSSDLLYNRGNVLSQADRLDEAIAAYEQAVLFKPNHLSALCNLGNTLRARGRYQEAIKRYEQAIAVNPDYADAHWDLSLTLLQLGDFERGWREHEWRMQCSALAKPVQYSQPQWAGESLVGKSILLHPEQGLGDTLQFVRYVQVVADLGARVYLGTQPELHALLKLIPGADMVVSYGQLPVFDVQCPLLSLPFVLGTRLDSVPAKVPYLFAEEGLVQQWAQKLGPSNGKKRVGLVWAGSKTHKNDRNRSIDPAKLSPLLQVPGFQFFSLQKGATGSTILAPPGAELIDHSGELNDFIDTAALIANLDLVISVDTSVAHLAGGMGKPVWLLLPRDPDWRWLLDRDDSPWYPTMKLFRQTTARDWEPVVQRMARELEAANF